MKLITVRLCVPDSTPDPVLGDYGRLSADQVAILASQPDATVTALTDTDITAIADGIASREYHATVAGIVEDLKRATADGEITDRDAAMEWIEQTIDGHHDVIYTACAQEILRQSRNDGAYFDDFGSEGAITDGGIEYSKLAYCALRADVLEAIADLDAWFTCDTCNGDVTPEDIAAAGENLPTCADCRADTDGADDAA